MNRLHAFFIHLLISLGLGATSFVLVFFLWYPNYLSGASGVKHIFLMLLLIDCVLGPCITFIIFNTKKKNLKLDLIIIAAIQLSALVYGLNAMYVARPVYIVFNVDRFDIAYGNDFDATKLKKVTNPQFQQLPLFSPQIIAARSPTNQEERNELLFSSVTGGDDLPQLPQYFVGYLEMSKVVKAHVQSIKNLYQFNSEKREKIANIQAKYDKLGFKIGFLPLKGKASDLTVILNADTAEVLEIVDLVPW